MVGWAEETTLDVEYAHSIAPGAKIVLAETPVAETEGTSGFPEMMNAEKSLINRGVGDVISQSFGATENTFPGFSGNYSSLLDLRYAFKDAYAHGVTVLAGSGDTGATNYESDGDDPVPVPGELLAVIGPAGDLGRRYAAHLNQAGDQLSPDTVWNDGFGASGGGTSAVFSRPLYQTGVTKEVGRSRGTPDISMSAAVNGGAWVYRSFAGTGGAGWYIVGGTSEATPIMSGIVALADQVAHHRLGLINPSLYLLGALQQHGVPHGHRERHVGQQLLRRRDRLRRRARLQPGHRLGHDRRGEVRSRARSPRLAPSRNSTSTTTIPARAASAPGPVFCLLETKPRSTCAVRR